MTKKQAAETWQEEEEGTRNNKKKERVKLANAACLCTFRTFNKQNLKTRI
jgi:hypothetical protein